MGRAQSTGDEAEVRVEAEAERRLQLPRRVADDDDPRRVDSQRHELVREERAVQVAPVAANELAAGDNDDRARIARRQGAGGALTIDFGVTSSCSALPVAAPGMTTIRPFSLATRFCGLFAANQSRRERNVPLVKGS